MFNLIDTTYTRVPSYMPLETALLSLRRIEAYMDIAQVKRFTITLHGGEPTLWPQEWFKALLTAIAKSRQRGRCIDIRVQTNAFKRLSQDQLSAMADAAVTLGISLDGPIAVNDRYRLSHNRNGSYSKIIENVQYIFDSGFGNLVGGFLSVMNSDIDPEDYLNWVAGLPVKRVDLIWPMHFNYDNTPWKTTNEEAYAKTPALGTWLSELFLSWVKRDDPGIEIRIFSSLIQLWLRRTDNVLSVGTLTDDIGDGSITHFVVNTDGQIEYPDYLRNAADGSCRTQYSITHTPLHELCRDSIFARLLGKTTPAGCIECSHVDLCGGGFLSGRISKTELLSSKKSVLCYDHMKFYSIVNSSLRKLHGSIA